MEELNDKWSIHQVVQKAIETAHTSPSPVTIKMLEEIKQTMDNNYSKRELDEHFLDVTKRFDTQDKLLTDLNSKVGIQNGRVTKLETRIGAGLLALGGITFLFGIITSLVVYSFKLSQENLKSSILLEVTELK